MKSKKAEKNNFFEKLKRGLEECLEILKEVNQESFEKDLREAYKHHAIYDKAYDDGCTNKKPRLPKNRYYMEAYKDGQYEREKEKNEKQKERKIY